MINGFELLPSLGEVYCRGILLQFARLHLNEGEILQVETTVNEKKITKRSPHYNDSLTCKECREVWHVQKLLCSS